MWQGDPEFVDVTLVYEGEKEVRHLWMQLWSVKVTTRRSSLDKTFQGKGCTHKGRYPLNILDKSAPQRGWNAVRPYRFWNFLWDHHILYLCWQPTFLPSPRLPPLHPLQQAEHLHSPWRTICPRLLPHHLVGQFREWGTVGFFCCCLFRIFQKLLLLSLIKKSFFPHWIGPTGPI